MRQWATAYLAKLAHKMSIVVGKKGANLSGQIVCRVDQNILRRLASQVDDTIFISGTNRKATASDLIGHTLKANNIEIIHNSEGVNMAAGITLVFIMKNVGGIEVAVIEIDEGSTPKVLKGVIPSMTIFTNLLRDQMDRFSEINVVVNNIVRSISSKGTKLILNADDPFVSYLKVANDTIVYCGIEAHAREFRQSTMNEGRYCPNCGRLLIYDYTYYNQLGYYHCECGSKQETSKYEVLQFEAQPFIGMDVNDVHFEAEIAGDFNTFNVLAACSVPKELGLNDDAVHKGLDTYTLGNGWTQYFKRGQKEAMISLARNSAGMNMSLSVGDQFKEKKVYAISLNDNAADDRDIFWIYDAGFEKLRNQNIEKIIVTGTRVEELQLRLKLAEIDVPIILEKGIYKTTALTMNYADFTVAAPNYTPPSSMSEQPNRSSVGGR